MLPISCTLEQIFDVLGTWFSSLNQADIVRLNQLTRWEPAASSAPRVFALIPRDPDALGTGFYTTSPEYFLDWVARRVPQGERWNILELLRFTPVPPDRLSVTLAFLREASDVMARPLVAMVELDCRHNVVVSFVAGTLGPQSLPDQTSQLMTMALLQRPLRSPATTDSCPRSFWAFGTMVGSGPVYLSLGPDAVVNWDPEQADGSMHFVTELVVAASEREPFVVRLFRLPDLTPLPLAGAQSHLSYAPEALADRRVALPLPITSEGCYVLQADGVSWQESIVFEVIAERLETIAPEALLSALPRGLRVISAFRDGPDTVRLGLVGPGLVARLSFGLGGLGSPQLPSTARCEPELAPLELCWMPHPVWGWPQTAVWHDGMRRYQLVVLSGGRDAWNREDLITLVQQLRINPLPVLPESTGS